MGLTLTDAMVMQSDYAKTIKGLYFDIYKVCDENTERIDYPDGKYYFNTKYTLRYYHLKVKKLKAYCRLFVISYYGDDNTLASFKFTTLNEAKDKYNLLLSNLSKKTAKGAELLKGQLGVFDAFIQASLKSDRFLIDWHIEGDI